ncbi:MAG: YtoQ family protein [Alphaproteobacteria bacterium]|tara:strand:- start:715 stop:1164 length:450 start_codon:yes stop_codon:yes gene_type:complete
MEITVYLSGEIHTEWRNEIINKSNELNLPIEFLSPNTNHELSDDVGVEILGKEDKKFWHDHKSAKINSIRTKNAIDRSDIVIVRFGEKYKQWNAAFDAGYASAMSKSLIIIHSDENQHALKEIDSVAHAVVKNVDEVIKILNYTCSSKI